MKRAYEIALRCPWKGPMWSTRWAQCVDLEHRDTSPWQEIARRLAPPAVHSWLWILSSVYLAGPFAQWIFPGQAGSPGRRRRCLCPSRGSPVEGVGVSVYNLFSNANMDFVDSLWGALPFRTFHWWAAVSSSVSPEWNFTRHQVMDPHTFSCE